MIDGMADRSQEILGRKTPLQVASTPNLDSLAACGCCGLMYPLTPERAPSSQLAHWNILGYGDIPFPGRAAIEALGAGVPLDEGEIVFSVNLATTTVEEKQTYVQASPARLPEKQA